MSQRIQVEKDNEFIGKDFDKWAYENKVRLDYSIPFIPTDNLIIDPFVSSLRDECLNTDWFLSLDDAYKKNADWLYDYNHY